MDRSKDLGNDWGRRRPGVSICTSLVINDISAHMNVVLNRLTSMTSPEQLVIPGNIIFRQRGTHWFPGTNVGMGRDHTIYATETGFVKYYKDPTRHPKRKYIGVAFDRDDKLPYPTDAPRKRRLNMVAVPIPTVVASSAKDAGPDGVLTPPAQPKVHTNEQTVFRIKPRKEGQPEKVLTMRPGYSYREANWEIGRAAERANVKVRSFQRGDRFLAWRKAAVRKEKNVDRRAMLRKTAIKKRR